jgi:hypothetical protein
MVRCAAFVVSVPLPRKYPLRKLLSDPAVVVLFAAMLTTLTTSALTSAYAAEATCIRPISDAAELSLVANELTGNRQSQAYWWSKADLTISIESSPRFAPAHQEAIERAIATWQQTVQDCLGDAVALIYVPVAPGARAQSDIVVHLVPHAGGSKFGGMSVCGPAGCTNTLVAYIGPPRKVPRRPGGTDLAHRRYRAARDRSRARARSCR